VAILFFQDNSEQQFLVVVPAALNAGPLSAYPVVRQLLKRSVHNKQVSAHVCLEKDGTLASVMPATQTS